jgi:sugar phosphate isomerase/epimerase
LLIMVDGEGKIGGSHNTERLLAVENHKKWVDAASYLGCSAIRINAHGDGSSDQIKENCIESIKSLAAYAQSQNIDILIENHGGISNNGTWLVSLLQGLADVKGVYALPDFDNWCWEREGSDFYNGKCLQTFDRYEGVKMLLPFAKGLSVKCIKFDSFGNEVNIDYAKMMPIVKAAGYNHYLGVEFEGEDIESKEGVEKIRKLVLKNWK